jgi:hypothetical protein
MVMDNYVIKNKNPKMGKKIREHFRSQGFETMGFSCDKNEEEGHTHVYYGVHNGEFDFYDFEEVMRKNLEIIELPKEKKFSKKEVLKLMRLTRIHTEKSIEDLFKMYNNGND